MKELLEAPLKFNLRKGQYRVLFWSQMARELAKPNKIVDIMPEVRYGVDNLTLYAIDLIKKVDDYKYVEIYTASPIIPCIVQLAVKIQSKTYNVGNEIDIPEHIKDMKLDRKCAHIFIQGDEKLEKITHHLKNLQSIGKFDSYATILETLNSLQDEI